MFAYVTAGAAQTNGAPTSDIDVARHLRHNGVAHLALFVALSGTSYAAAKLPSKSVGSTQLKSNAVTSAKVEDRSLRARWTSPR